MSNELHEAVCNAMCPTTWKTSEPRPHTKECRAIGLALEVVAANPDLAMLVSRLIRQVRKYDPQNPVAYQAHNYLERKGLLPSVIDR